MKIRNVLAIFGIALFLVTQPTHAAPPTPTRSAQPSYAQTAARLYHAQPGYASLGAWLYRK